MNRISYGTVVEISQHNIDVKHDIVNRLYISVTLLNELRMYGLASPDREVCGLITGDVQGTSWQPNKFTPITNVSTGKYGYDDYVMDPNESLDVLERTSHFPGESISDLVAVFHTHPNSTPYPSAIDIRHAAYNVIYIIYSLAYDEFTFNMWDGSWFRPVKVEVIE